MAQETATAEVDSLRERMRGVGFGYDEIAAELARRYRVRPREAYRLAYGWTPEQAAQRFNARAAKENADPEARASLTGSRLCEYEKWPAGARKPSVYVLVMLATIYDTDVLCLLDLADHEHLAPQDRLALLRRPRAVTPFGEKLGSLLEARGLSMREVARRIRCSAGYLSNISHGDKRATEDIATRLDELLDARGELAALAEAPVRARRSTPIRNTGPQVVSAPGISLSLPYVPGRVVIDISGPAVNDDRLGSEADYHDALNGQLTLLPAVREAGERTGET
jgi:transcriptional regulator with XRE-family HTH domain